ncbi:hypothetical protein TcWFU_006468 [Taenia crassiceps]|uniref:Uncharacterized protein n=1 Tax=Taenia crassiceps TaxID=6207 RepID=A0ABR4Q428_9CEST
MGYAYTSTERNPWLSAFGFGDQISLHSDTFTTQHEKQSSLQGVSLRHLPSAAAPSFFNRFDELGEAEEAEKCSLCLAHQSWSGNCAKVKTAVYLTPGTGGGYVGGQRCGCRGSNFQPKVPCFSAMESAQLGLCGDVQLVEPCNPPKAALIQAVTPRLPNAMAFDLVPSASTLKAIVVRKMRGEVATKFVVGSP